MVDLGAELVALLAGGGHLSVDRVAGDNLAPPLRLNFDFVFPITETRRGQNFEERVFESDEAVGAGDRDIVDINGEIEPLPGAKRP